MTQRESSEHRRRALVQQIALLEAQLAEARNDLRELEARAAEAAATQVLTPARVEPCRVHAGSVPAAKVALFMERFAGVKPRDVV